jgi:hypothetical protein
VFAVALFRYTTSGEVPGGWEAADLDNAIRVHGRRVATP